ncbi:hypothetical protein TYRP_014263 [Tyrophagus putrescentiae]|nr:hypothetical protein TYRP_014263 [Tyrophagus putrescentiae]
MGQTMIAKYQPPPSRQQIDEEMNDLLQTVFDCHMMSRVVNRNKKTKSARCDIAETLYAALKGLLIVERVDGTAPTEYTVSRFLDEVSGDPALLETIALNEWPTPNDRPLPPLVTPEESLFFFECKHCSAARDDGYGVKSLPPASSSSFQMALPSHCNHPVCTACLSWTSAADRLVDLYNGSDYQCRLLICPVCGVASSRLLLFDHRNRHLLYKGRCPTWMAKVVALYLTTCLTHRHLFSALSSHHYFPQHRPDRKYLQLLPDTHEQAAEVDFWMDNWLATAKRHFLDAVTGGESGDGWSVEAEELAKFNVYLYVESVYRLVCDARMDQGLAWSLPPEQETVKASGGDEEGGGLRVDDDPDFDRCRICFEPIRPRRKYALLDCCSHRYCIRCADCLASERKLKHCPTCRRPANKMVSHWRFYPQGSPAKKALFDQVKCVHELLPSWKREEAEGRHHQQENNWVEVENEVEAVVEEIFAENAALANAGGEEVDQDSWTEMTTTEAADFEMENKSTTEENSKSGGELGLGNFLWSLLTGCIFSDK